MSLETLLAAAEYLEWRSGQESIGLSHQTNKDVASFPSSPVKRGAPSSAYASQSQQQADARNEDSSESGERKRWAGTREVHNKLEKNRRAHLKECFEMLRKEIPSMDDRKISNLSILQKALRHVESVKTKGVELEEEKKKMAAILSATQAKLARLKQDVKSMGMIDDVDAWLSTQQEAADCTTSTASECGDEGECFEENAIKVGSRGPRKSWKTEASWPVRNGKVELKVLRAPPQQPQQPQQQPALQRMQHAVVRATLQQRLHMRANSDTPLASMRNSPVDRANGLIGSSDATSARHAAQSSVSVPPPPPLSFEPSGIHSSALIRAARAAGHPTAVRGSVSSAAGSNGSSSNGGAGIVSISSFSNTRPDCSAAGGGAVAAMTSQANHHGATSHGVVLSSLPMQQQQQQHLFLLPTGTSALVAAAAAPTPLQSTVTALSLPPGTKRVLAPLQPVAVSAAGATMAQPIVGATSLVFPAQQFAPATAAMFPYFFDALRHPTSLSLVPCHAPPPARDQLLQQPQPHKPAATVCSVGVPIGGGASASTPTSEPASLRPTAVMPSSSSPFRPVVGHATGTVVSLVPASAPAATAPGGGDGSASGQQLVATAGTTVRSAVASSSGSAAALAGGSGAAAQLHIQTAQLPAAPSPLLAKQAPLHIVTAPQQYVLMMAAPASQDAVPSIATGAQASATFEPSCRSVAGDLRSGSSGETK